MASSTVPPQLKKAECLIAVIGDEDTIVGLLLSGFGNIDVNRSSNFFVVDPST